MLAGKHIAQTCRSVPEIPNNLFPANNRTGTVNPITGPATYQGHGRRSKSNISKVIDFKEIKTTLNKVEIF